MELIISFTDKSNSFVCGVEFGRLLNKMEMGISPLDNQKFPVHSHNKQVIINACKYYNYTPIFSKSIVEGWIEFIAIQNLAYYHDEQL